MGHFFLCLPDPLQFPLGRADAIVGADGTIPFSAHCKHPHVVAISSSALEMLARHIAAQPAPLPLFGSHYDASGMFPASNTIAMPSNPL